jgi:hypothetical protein
LSIIGTHFEDLYKVREILARLDDLPCVLVRLEILFKERFNGESGQELSSAVEIPNDQLA